MPWKRGKGRGVKIDIVPFCSVLFRFVSESQSKIAIFLEPFFFFNVKRCLNLIGPFSLCTPVSVFFLEFRFVTFLGLGFCLFSFFWARLASCQCVSL